MWCVLLAAGSFVDIYLHAYENVDISIQTKPPRHCESMSECMLQHWLCSVHTILCMLQEGISLDKAHSKGHKGVDFGVWCCEPDYHWRFCFISTGWSTNTNHHSNTNTGVQAKPQQPQLPQQTYYHRNCKNKVNIAVIVLFFAVVVVTETDADYLHFAFST